MEPIASLQNARVKHVVKLRDRKGRERQGRIVVDGLREIRLALSHGVQIVEVFCCEALCVSDEARQLRRDLEIAGIVPVLTTASVWDKLTFGNRRDGLLAVAVPPSTGLSEIRDRDLGHAPPFLVILDAIEKPGNVGAVCRTADGAGVSAVILTEPLSDPFNPNTIRASLGAVFRRPPVVVSRAELWSYLRQENIHVFAAHVDAQQTYNDVDYATGCALVLGSEARGLGPEWIEQGATPISLPMRGAVDSLNVSNAAAILMYEVVRQREGASR